MPGKITSFEDYRRNDDPEMDDMPVEEVGIDESDDVREDIGAVHNKTDATETMVINNIEIADPYNFFNEEEREAYFRQREREDRLKKKKTDGGVELKKERGAGRVEKRAPRDDQERPRRREEGYPPRREDEDMRTRRRDDGYPPRRDDEDVRPRRSNTGRIRDDADVRPRRRNDDYDPRDDEEYERRGDTGRIRRREDDRPRRRDDIDDDYRRDDYRREDDRYRRRSRNDYDDYNDGYDDYNDDYDPDYDGDYGDDEEDERIKLMLVRASSIITGVVILVILMFIVKAKFIDKVGSADQEAETATEQAKDDKDGGEVSIPEGYRKTDDTVYVSGASLNLRSEPNTSDDSTIVENVNQGTEFKRIAVSADGAWALLEYNGKIVYGYQNYLAVKDE